MPLTLIILCGHPLNSFPDFPDLVLISPDIFLCWVTTTKTTERRLTSELCMCAQSYLTLDGSLPGCSVYGIFQQNTGAGCRFLLKGIFPTQGSNLSLLHLLHWQWILYHYTTWQAPLVSLCIYCAVLVTNRYKL